MRTLEPSVALPTRLPANCLAGDAVGNAVRITGDRVAGRYQATSVDIDATAAHEARGVGVIASKSDATTCVIQTGGILSGVLSGLTPGRLLFVAADATLSESPPPRPSSGYRTIQAMAYALAADVAVISPGPSHRVLPE